ncbi:MAG: dihydroorotate dehydrogenase-like protein [Rikenellaceae bacterium]
MENQVNMDGLATTFATLELRNPIIASSCSLTGSVKSNKALAEAGVGAIVLKSLFEEDIARENEAMASQMAHVEGADYMQSYVSAHVLGNYATLIKESKAACGDVPIIASINCMSAGEWVDYARVVEAAGADALELNVMSVECDAMAADGAIEQRYISIAQSVSAATSLPLIMKLSLAVSNHASLVSRLMASGVKGVVMFNRFYQTDIDIESMTYCRGEVLSTASDFATPLRYTAVVSAAVPTASLALSGGVQGGECVVKALLAGASAVEVCSTLYRQSDGAAAWVAQTLGALQQWQSSKGYELVLEYVGAMNNSKSEYRDEVMRAQFLKHFGAYR